jgi:hypothetical protein
MKRLWVRIRDTTNCTEKNCGICTLVWKNRRKPNLSFCLSDFPSFHLSVFLSFCTFGLSLFLPFLKNKNIVSLFSLYHKHIHAAWFQFCKAKQYLKASLSLSFFSLSFSLSSLSLRSLTHKVTYTCIAKTFEP